MSAEYPKLDGWRNVLLPLPREIAIAQWVDCRPGDVGVRVVDEAGELEEQAGAELRQLFADRGGVDPDGTDFEIVLGVATGGSLAGMPIDVVSLHDRPNRQQAYLITPHGGNRLLLSALDGRGVYYAARTLYQLLEFTMSPQKVCMPLVTVRDWPDVEERGLWNFPDAAEWIPWMASLKLNYGKMVDTRLATVERGRRNHADIDAGLMRQAARRALNYVPYVVHLNFLHDCGLFRAYPELAGKGDGALSGRYVAHKQGDQHRVPCASQPKLVEILAEWMIAIAAQGAREISCWLSERPGQCGCSACTATGQFVLEARAFTAAWRRARSQYPGLAIRLFLSTTTSEMDPQRVGRWATLIGSIEFDVYDSDFPMCYSWGRAVEMVGGRIRPRLGEGMFCYYLDEADFELKKTVCAEALALVADGNYSDLSNETRVVSSYVNLAHSIFCVAELVATADPGAPAIQDKLLAMVEALELVGAENIASIRTWRSGLGPEPWHPRVHDAVDATQRTVAEIARTARKLC